MEISSEVIIAVIGTITTIVVSWTTHWLTRKKYRTEVDEGVISNLEHSLELYKKIVDDNTARLDKVLQRNKELEAEVEELRSQVQKLKEVCNSLKGKGTFLIKETPKQVKGKTVKSKASNTKKNADNKEGE